MSFSVHRKPDCHLLGFQSFCSPLWFWVIWFHLLQRPNGCRKKKRIWDFFGAKHVATLLNWRGWCKIVPWHRLSGFQILRQSHFWEGSKTSCVYLSIWRNLVQPWMPQFFPIVLWYFFPTFSWFIIFQLRIAINRGIPNFRQNQIIYSMLCICIYVCAEYILPRFMPSCGWETHFISRWLPVACTRNMDTTSLVCSLHSPPESYPLVN